jgi:hypothetical protein
LLELAVLVPAVLVLVLVLVGLELVVLDLVGLAQDLADLAVVVAGDKLGLAQEPIDLEPMDLELMDQAVPAQAAQALAALALAALELPDANKVHHPCRTIHNSLFGMQWSLMRTAMVNLTVTNF